MKRHPAFKQGYEAFYNGIVENPFAQIFKGRYTERTIEAKEYTAGQNEAYFENLEKLERD